MPHIDIYAHAYPEQLLAATRDAIRAEERRMAERELAAVRRRERRAAVWARVTGWLRR